MELAASADPGEILGFFACVLVPLYLLGRLLYPLRAASIAPPKLPCRLFAVSFALSLSLLVLVLLDVVDALSAPSRRALWRAILLAHLALLVIGLPLAQILLILRRVTGASGAAAAPLCLPPLLGWLYIFYRIGDPFPVDSLRENAWREDDTMLSFAFSGLSLVLHLCINRAGIIGVFLTAAMSGAGAVTSPAAALARWLRPVTPIEVRTAERAVLASLHMLLQGNRRLAAVMERHEAEVAEAVEAGAAVGRAVKRRSSDTCRTSESGGACAEAKGGEGDEGGVNHPSDESLGSRCLSAILRAGRLAYGLLHARSRSFRSSSQLWAARRETVALRRSLNASLATLDELEGLLEAEAHARTRRGRAEEGLGLIFLGYAIQKVVVSVASLLWRQHGRRATASSSRAEPVLFRALGHAGALSAPTARALSLLVVGILLISSTRGFLRHVSRLSARLDAAGGAAGKQRHGRMRPGASLGIRPKGAAAAATSTSSKPNAQPFAPLPGCGSAPSSELASQDAASARAPLPSFVDVVGCTTAQVMGFYFFSAVLLVRASLPWRYRGGIEAAVGSVEFSFYHHWFDSIFLFSALLTAGIVGLQMTLASHRRRSRSGSDVAGSVSSQRQRHAAIAARERAKRAVVASHGAAAGARNAAAGLTISAGGTRRSSNATISSSAGAEGGWAIAASGSASPIAGAAIGPSGAPPCQSVQGGKLLTTSDDLRAFAGAHSSAFVRASLQDHVYKSHKRAPKDSVHASGSGSQRASQAPSRETSRSSSPRIQPVTMGALPSSDGHLNCALSVDSRVGDGKMHSNRSADRLSSNSMEALLPGDELPLAPLPTPSATELRQRKGPQVASSAPPGPRASGTSNVTVGLHGGRVPSSENGGRVSGTPGEAPSFSPRFHGLAAGLALIPPATLEAEETPNAAIAGTMASASAAASRGPRALFDFVTSLEEVHLSL